MTRFLYALANDWIDDERWYVRWPATLAAMGVMVAVPVVIATLVLAVGALVVIVLTG